MLGVLVGLLDGFLGHLCIDLLLHIETLWLGDLHFVYPPGLTYRGIVAVTLKTVTQRLLVHLVAVQQVCLRGVVRVGLVDRLRNILHLSVSNVRICLRVRALSAVDIHLTILLELRFYLVLIAHYFLRPLQRFLRDTS